MGNDFELSEHDVKKYCLGSQKCFSLAAGTPQIFLHTMFIHFPVGITSIACCDDFFFLKTYTCTHSPMDECG